MTDFIKKETSSFGYAIEGIRFALKTQVNFKIQSAIALTSTVAAFLLGFNEIEWILLLTTISIVIFSELINTVVEELVNLSTSDFHPKAKIAKDLSAGAVLVVSIMAAIIGAFLFVPHL